MGGTRARIADWCPGVDAMCQQGGKYFIFYLYMAWRNIKQLNGNVESEGFQALHLASHSK